jgi:molybdate transport system ATP-binding protein
VLAARLSDRRGALELDVELAAIEGTTTVLVGESGAGKTSILRALAGLDRTARGRITLDGTDWLDTGRGVSLPPWRREVGYVPQDYASSLPIGGERRERVWAPLPPPGDGLQKLGDGGGD